MFVFCLGHMRSGLKEEALPLHNSRLRHRAEESFYEETTDNSERVFMMMYENGYDNSDLKSEIPHKCTWSCLGPLTFHSQAKGSRVRLSKGGHLAERKRSTFKNGLLFSSREVKPLEKIRLRVEKDLHFWHGGLRVGFTNVPPSSRSLPLPQLAIPDLTSTPGHWAFHLRDSMCTAGSELEFWVSTGGSIYVSGNDCNKQKLGTGVDLSQPLWAFIDLYGNTCSIFLMGSKRTTLLGTKTSCPLSKHLNSAAVGRHNNSINDILYRDGVCDEHIYCYVDPTVEKALMQCVVCMVDQAKKRLPCGHQCLCDKCHPRVLEEFGSCPLCRCTM